MQDNWEASEALARQLQEEDEALARQLQEEEDQHERDERERQRGAGQDLSDSDSDGGPPPLGFDEGTCVVNDDVTMHRIIRDGGPVSELEALLTKQQSANVSTCFFFERHERPGCVRVLG